MNPCYGDFIEVPHENAYVDMYICIYDILLDFPEFQMNLQFSSSFDPAL